jgi:hypothetical protein
MAGSGRLHGLVGHWFGVQDERLKRTSHEGFAGLCQCAVAACFPKRIGLIGVYTAAGC